MQKLAYVVHNFAYGEDVMLFEVDYVELANDVRLENFG